MKTGRTLQELAVEIERQSAGKRDFLADTRELTMLTTADGSELHIAGSGEFGLRPLAHQQIADYLDIPRKFYGRLARQTCSKECARRAAGRRRSAARRVRRKGLAA